MNRRVFLALGFCFLAVVAGSQWYASRQLAAARNARAAVEQIEAACLDRLDSSIDLHGECLPLHQLSARLARITGLEVHLEDEEISRALEGQYFTHYRHLQFEPTSPGKFKLQLPVGTMPLGDALDLALEPYGLTCEVRGQSLVVTSLMASHDRTRLRLAVYSMPQPGPAGLESEAWARILESQVEPSTWEQFGGQGHSEHIPGGAVVVQTAHVHRRLERFLSDISRLESPAATSLQRVSLGGDVVANRRLRDALATPSSLLCDEEPLSEVLRGLSARHDVPIFLNASRLNLARIPLDAPVSAEIDGQPLEAVLHSILDPLELTFSARKGAIVITTPVDEGDSLQTAAYPIGDLIPDRSPRELARLQELITSTIAPNSWDEVGGPGTAQPLGSRWLLISQTAQAHEQIVDLLGLLRHALSEGASRPMPLGDSPTAHAIEKALESEIAFEYPRSDLTAVCADLSQRLGINVRVNTKKLEEAGVRPDLPLICSFPPASMRVQVSRLCDALELTQCIRDDALWLTTPEEAESELITRIYDARPLTDPDLGLTDRDSLIGLVTTHIVQESWDELGGPGGIEEFRGLLFISQTDEVHRQIASLLEQFETHCLPRLQPANAPKVVYVSPNAEQERLEEALQRPISINLCGVPLDEAMEQIAAEAGAPITVELSELAQCEVSERSVVSHSAHSLPLNRLLDELLPPLELDYYVVNEHILVTSLDSSASTPLVRIYPTDATDQSQAEDFVKRVQDEVDSDGWHAVGGPNEVSLLNQQWLVVSAYRHTHCELSDWLSQQRQNTLQRPRPIMLSIRQPSRPRPQFAALPVPEDPLLVDFIERRLLCGSSQLAIGHTIPFGPWSFHRVRPQSPPPAEQLCVPDGSDPFASPAPTIPANEPTTEPDPFAPTDRDPFADP